MSEQLHTKEPWNVRVEHDITGYPTYVIAGISRGEIQEIQANARRIVACVNVCAGIPDHLLNQCGGATEVTNQWIIERDRLTTLNAELVEALESPHLSKLMKHCDDYCKEGIDGKEFHDSFYGFAKLRFKALAKAKAVTL